MTPSLQVQGLLPVLIALLLLAGHSRGFEFPSDFRFSGATASYQVEGAWNTSGKGENIWDRLLHVFPGLVLDDTNGDIACDSYHKWEEDVQMVKDVGFDMYRFSLSWSRILPTGAIDKVNSDGIRYYNNIIDALISKNITPMVTIFHWDLPQPLLDIGGWPNEDLIDYYVDYVELVFREFGDRVKLWITFNEPFTICEEGWGTAGKAPAIKSPGRGDYLCAHTLLKAHARAYHMYYALFNATQKGKVGISLNSNFMQPEDADSEEDIDAAERALQFNLGWYANPIFSASGDYPAVMRERIANISKAQHLTKSRLPTFSEEEIKMIRGSADFFGLNQYTTSQVTYKPWNTTFVQSLDYDGNYTTSFNSSWTPTIAEWMRVTPWGLRGILKWIQTSYGNVSIIITENGCPDHGQLKDTFRVNYYRGYLNALLESIHIDKVNVFGYTAWSLMDNFEWLYGYVHKFGIHYVNFADPNRTRTAKMSSTFFQQVISTRKVPDEDPYFPDDNTTATTESTDSNNNTTTSAAVNISIAIGVLALALASVLPR